MSKKQKDLQPWLDYFQMLHTYEEKGFLYIKQDEREAYITRAALMTLVPGDVLAKKTDKGILADTARRIRAYAAFKAQQGEACLRENFALHIVKEDEPHDLLHTIVLSIRRPWWKLCMCHDNFEIIDYHQRPLIVTPKQDPPTPPAK